MRFCSCNLGPFGILVSESSSNVNWPAIPAPGSTFVVKLFRCRGRSAIAWPFYTGYHPSKLELEALAGTIAAVTPTSGPNIYIPWSVKRTSKICSPSGQAVQNYMWCCLYVLSGFLHYSTQQSCWRTDLIAPVQW